jgi:hypothetical protein
MKTKTSVFGYVVLDKAGVVAIFPDWTYDELLAAAYAASYAKRNTILETVEMARGEYVIEFKIRLNRLADEWRKKMKRNK